MNESKILYATFSVDKSCLAVAKQNTFYIYNIVDNQLKPKFYSK